MMDESTKNSPCKDYKGDEDLQAEVILLRQYLVERDSHIATLEGEYLTSSDKITDLEDQLAIWREKYERLYDSHKRVQKLNQVLEDKLLQMVDTVKGEKTQLTKDIATISVRLAESKHSVGMLQKENERYKNDMNLAIQLLQCKPDNFVSQKLDNLPVDTQARVSQYVMSKTKNTTPLQSKNGNDNETFDTNEYEFNISASLMSKILEDSIQDTVTKHCDTCTCSKSQHKPFCYNESHYSVCTQTKISGDLKKYLCLNCSTEIISAHSNISIRSSSPHALKLVEESIVTPMMADSMYLVPQNSIDKSVGSQVNFIDNNYNGDSITSDKVKILSNQMIETENLDEISNDFKHLRKTINMEPGVHHKLCERTRRSASSNKGSNNSAINDDFHRDNEIFKDQNTTNNNKIVGNNILRQNSQGSMGAISRTSSLAKSSSSTHKSNTQVGPGPRFCSLRMQAGSKNILLDNAQPDVPPILYKRQSKCNDTPFFKDLNEGVNNFIDIDKNDIGRDHVVVESTLIDVHVDNNTKDPISSKTSSINPVLMNVSSSPLQPLKTHHSFSITSERNNNSVQNNASPKSFSKVDTLLNNVNVDDNCKITLTNSTLEAGSDNLAATVDNQDVKIFNFDRYEQNKLPNQFTKSLRKIDMSNFHKIENTKISKDFPPQGDLSKKSITLEKPSLPAIVNVYPNLTQTHLKANDSKKMFTNGQSTSSLSSDDSAALLHKQQLLRVAEWVEKNLELQNNLNDPLVMEDDQTFSNKSARRETKLHRLADSLEMALKMPHPVSKYSKAFTRAETSSWLLKDGNKTENQGNMPIANQVNVTKETMFPVDNTESNVTSEILTPHSNNVTHVESSVQNIDDTLKEILNVDCNKEVTPEDLARMEYNVKKFLLSGPYWDNPEAAGRSRHTVSKTETDV